MSLHYSGANSYLFVNGTEIHQFKATDTGILAGPLCLGNISKDFSVDNMKKLGLNGDVYDFSVDYYAIAVDDILDIHKYLMKKNGVYKMFRFIKKVFFTAITFFSYDVLNVNSLKWISMNNQECKTRTNELMKQDT